MLTLNMLKAASALSDEALVARLKLLAGREREATVELVAHLAELDTRRVHVAEGYSLYTYCTDVLHLSEHAAYGRIEVARAVRRFPVILDRLADGSVNLTTVGLLARHLTPENHVKVLAEARHLTKPQVEMLVAHLAPRPDVPATIRKLPAPGPLMAPAALLAAPHSVQTELAAAPPLSPVARPVVAPLSPDRYRVQFTVGGETQEKLRKVQGLLRREIPNGDPGEIFDRGLTLLLREIERKKLAGVAKPRPGRATRSGPSSGSRGVIRRPSRHIPAAVKRAVWVRDNGQCAFVGRSGRRCTEKVFLEFHHEDPYALGGEATVDKVSLRCRRHNVYEAELIFGRFDPGEAAPSRAGTGPPTVVTRLTPPGPGT